MTNTGKKNLVLITLDDAVAFWKFKTIFGETLQTPNLDRICETSTAFHSAYCQAPVCSPSRASFMSARSPHHTGVTGPSAKYFDKIPPQEMWPCRLRRNGFFCSTSGKVMRGYAPLPDEVHKAIYSDEPKSFSLGRRKRIFKQGIQIDEVRRKEFGGYRGGEATMDEKDDQDYYDHQVADSMLSFLDNHDADVPFYREIGLVGSHGPWATPVRYKKMYDEKNFQKPEAWNDGFDTSDVMDRLAPRNIETRRSHQWKKSVRNYFSAVSHTDHHLGRIWDAIKSSRHADNTIVIILSDHGFHLGERNRFRKHTLWEQVANVPLIIHDPAAPVAQVVDDPVGLIDVGPTVMDYLGLPPIDGSVGRSLRPQMGRRPAPNRAVPTFFHQSAAIRKGKYRFIRYEDGSTQFFDLSQDWWQTRDLGSKHPDYAEMQEAFVACCKDYGFDVHGTEAAVPQLAVAS